MCHKYSATKRISRDELVLVLLNERNKGNVGSRTNQNSSMFVASLPDRNQLWIHQSHKQLLTSLKLNHLKTYQLNHRGIRSTAAL